MCVKNGVASLLFFFLFVTIKHTSFPIIIFSLSQTSNVTHNNTNENTRCKKTHIGSFFLVFFFASFYFVCVCVCLSLSQTRHTFLSSTQKQHKIINISPNLMKRCKKGFFFASVSLSQTSKVPIIVLRVRESRRRRRRPTTTTTTREPQLTTTRRKSSDVKRSGKTTTTSLERREEAGETTFAAFALFSRDRRRRPSRDVLVSYHKQFP